MPDRLSLHAPILVNTLGHCAGVIVFGILLWLLLLDWRRDSRGKSPLAAIAAGLALLWNLGSLIGLATQPGDAVADVIVAGSFSVLSLLPAVLLHISMGARHRLLWLAGYMIGVLAVVLHISDLITAAPRFHYAAILLITIGFAGLTAIALVREFLAGKRDGGARLAGAMVLFLFAISFAHFETAHNAKAWSGEAALHHAGIPLALFVLLQDYRFLLLDAFIRFVVNALLAAGAVWMALAAESKFGLLNRAAHDPFFAGVVFSGACLALGVFSMARSRLQRWLTRAVFLRASAEPAIARLRSLAADARNENDYLRAASGAIAEFLSAARFEAVCRTDIQRAAAVLDPARGNLEHWVEAVAAFRFARGDRRALLLGPRAGGRRYLSEDVEILERLAGVVSEQVERIRTTEMQALVSQAELRALQAQINPHFLFNSLNTLYGTIGRENIEARRLVSNLAGLLRYFFTSERNVIRIEEELAIVRAYLEIEQLRLGPKLVAEIDVDDSALSAEVPVLSIQPLVENAVKHGVAQQIGTGFVRLAVRRGDTGVGIEISNSGTFRELSPEQGAGVGLANVRRRLALCYGADSRLDVSGEGETTSVRFSVPIRIAAAAVHS